METETQTLIREHTVLQGWLVIEAAGDLRRALGVTPEELQAIVQAAYDQHGIMASPSYAAEADLATAVDQAMAVADGLCSCGADGCSDRDAR